MILKSVGIFRFKKNSTLLIWILVFICDVFYGCDDKNNTGRNVPRASRKINTASLEPTSGTLSPNPSPVTNPITTNPLPNPIPTPSPEENILFVTSLFEKTSTAATMIDKFWNVDASFGTNFSVASWPQDIKKALITEFTRFPLNKQLYQYLDAIYLVETNGAQDGEPGGLATLAKSGEKRAIVIISYSGLRRAASVYGKNSIAIAANYLSDQYFMYLLDTLVHETMHSLDYAVKNEIDFVYALHDNKSNIAALCANPSPTCTRFNLANLSFSFLSYVGDDGEISIETYFSPRQGINNFVTDYARANIFEDWAETMSVYYMGTRYDFWREENYSSDLEIKNSPVSNQSMKDKTCKMVNFIFNDMAGLQENCERCLSRSCVF